MPKTLFGTGTVNFTTILPVGTAQEFSQDVKSGGITHAYTEGGDSTTYLDGSGEPPGTSGRTDTLTLACDWDLGAAGFYNFLYTNDGVDATAEFTPSTADAAMWSGTVRLRLPDGATADSYGAKMSGTATFNFVGPVVFTPGP